MPVLPVSFRRVVALLAGSTAVLGALPAWCQPTQTAPPAVPPAAVPSAPEMKKGPVMEVEKEADPNALGVSLEIDTRSQYVFRGLALSKGVVVQPSLSLARRGTTLSVFGDANTSQRDGRREFIEFDYSISQEINLRGTTITPGFVYYDYPHGTFEKTGELNLAVSHLFGGIKLFTNQNLDVLKYGSAYFGEFGVSHEKELGHRLSGVATLSVALANDTFNKANFGEDKNALNVLFLGGSTTYKASDHLYLRPHLSYSRILDSKLRGAVETPMIFEGGGVVGFTF